jgi:hypothetical protein
MNLMKYFLPGLAFAFFACTNESEPVDNSGHAEAMSVRTEMVSSRNMITDNRFPDGAELGITVVDNRNGVFTYDGLTDGYYNICYKARGTYPDQVWTAYENPIYLSSTDGRAVAYYPYHKDCNDFTAIPIKADDQTDYMYSGWYAPLNNLNSEATFKMNHAMAGIRIAVKRGSYTGQGKVSEMSLTSLTFGVKGVLDATNGTITGVTPAEEKAIVSTYMMKPVFQPYIVSDADYTNTLLMVVPKSGVKGDIEISVMVDGRTYLVEGNFPQALKSGSIYTFKLTLDNTALSIAGDVEVTPWLEDDSATTENNGVLKPNT